MRRRTVPVLALVVAIGLVVVSCGSATSEGHIATPKEPGRASSDLRGELVVSNAASLTTAFTEIGADFERANPGTSVSFNPDSSSTLAAQIERGAPADVFASADEKTMDRLVQGDKVAGSPEVFARNRLVVITKPGNPEKIETLGDLAKADTISLCAADAPCGKYAAEVLSGAHVTIDERSITRGTNATATAQALSQGDAAAGIVYVTDAKTAGKAVETVEIPDDQNAIAAYPIAALAGAENRPLAEAFVAYVTSVAGQRVLRRYGFLPPT